ncbi:MAG TPA: type II toxin-antitoxin system VapC family toxin [Candidatus Thermoplasmatota archaeon]
MIYLDANVFIYSSSDEGPKGKAAGALLRQALVEGAATASLTIDEFLWAMRKKLGRPVAAEKARQLFALDVQIAAVTRDDAESAISLFADGVDPRDAIHAVVARRLGCSKIISSDPAFDKVTGLTRVAY